MGRDESEARKHWQHVIGLAQEHQTMVVVRKRQAQAARDQANHQKGPALAPAAAQPTGALGGSPVVPAALSTKLLEEAVQEN